MGLSVTIGTLLVMTVITNCEGTSKIDHRESHSTLKGPLIHSQGTLPCAGVLSGGEKNMTESELWARLDWLEGLVLQIASEHSHDRIAITAIGSNILMTIIFCRTLLYVYRQLRMDRDIKLGAKSDRAKWPDSNNGTMNVKTAIASIEFQGSNVNASTMTESSLEYKQGKSIGSWAEQSRVHWGKLCLVCQQGVHYNLVQCVNMKEYLPVGLDAKDPHKSLCKVCLGTITKNGSECNHQGQKAWHRTYCPVGGSSYLLCSMCPQHLGGQVWWKDFHQPKVGFKNYMQIVKDLSIRVTDSYV